MPLINTRRMTESQAWNRWAGLNDLSVRGRSPLGKQTRPVQAFATPPRRTVAMPRQSLLSMPTAFIRPMAPPVSRLGNGPASAASVIAQGVTRAPSQMTPLPTPAQAVFGVGLTPMQITPISTGGTLTRPGSMTARALPRGVSYLPAAVAQRTAMTPWSPAPMSVPIQPGSAGPGTWGGRTYLPGLQQIAAEAAPGKPADAATLMEGSMPDMNTFAAGGVASGDTPEIVDGVTDIGPASGEPLPPWVKWAALGAAVFGIGALVRSNR